MTLDRTKVFNKNNPLPPGNSNFGIYRPRYSRVQKRVTYKDLNFEKLRHSTQDKMQGVEVPQFSTLEPITAESNREKLRHAIKSDASESEIVNYEETEPNSNKY